MNATFREGIEMEIEIDYDLVAKIGATHYMDNGDYYAVKGSKLMCYSSDKVWKDSINTAGFALENVKPIPPKPQVRFEYELVTGSVFDLKDEFERGELFVELLGNSVRDSAEYKVIREEDSLINGFVGENIYRRVEKVVDWNYAVVESNNYGGGTDIERSYPEGLRIRGIYAKDDAVNLAKAILRATGELK